MSYSSNETSTVQPVAVELYTMVYNNVTYRFTSADSDQTYLGHNYSAIPISRGSRQRSMNAMDVSGIEIVMPVGRIPACNELYGYSSAFSIDILRVFSDGAFRTIFSGDVLNYSIEESILRLNCYDLKHRLTEKVARVKMTSYCNNSLYDSVCGLDPSIYRMVISAQKQTLNTPIPYGSAFFASYAAYETGAIPSCTLLYSDIMQNALGKFLSDVANETENGLLEQVSSGKKHIIVQNDVTNKLLSVAPIIHPFAPGELFYAYYGCPKNHSVCLSRFNNLTRFVGFPTIPTGDGTISIRAPDRRGGAYTYS